MNTYYEVRADKLHKGDKAANIGTITRITTSLKFPGKLYIAFGVHGANYYPVDRIFVVERTSDAVES